ncbi:MAG TPA: potassium-transporting ATPase subunit KdpC [Acidobacteriaceae bacterium]|nr:potassium-transporting ATPase subunit KdpC [Acidobacteriaceae bacterium]
MKKHIVTALLYTAVTAILFGVGYPLLITGIAQLLFHQKADGQLITRDNQIAGSEIIGQPFTGAAYFHSRPSAAGTGYDASSSSGSNLAPTSKALIDRVAASVNSETSGEPIPIDLVTASGSGLDPDISPAAALYQVPRVARERHLGEDAVRKLVESHITGRQFGLLGEPRVNVLSLNLSLDELTNSQRNSSQLSVVRWTESPFAPRNIEQACSASRCVPKSNLHAILVLTPSSRRP